ncbi:hypothetical protein PsYK624_161650 [Phanerochaete sordida]|uniref:DUF6534 domain-containing protein n=1 Tax=Phanerochaete sordida TaxID=48140 RepID=A0A9P3GQH3_9APHY|nr:hypothetical protein PsYK624_161650 [Phanerochaete sordida]
MSTPMTPPLQPSRALLNVTLGALLLGGFAAAILFGILSQQCFTFFRIFTREGPVMKFSVVVLWATATAHLGLAIYSDYTVTITEIGLLSGRAPATIAAIVATTGFADVIVRVWFMHRLWILGEKRPILQVLPIACNMTILGGTAYFSVAMARTGSLDFSPKLTHVFVALIALAVAMDFYIAIGICFFLWRQRSKITYRRTRDIVTTIMIYTVNTGLITGFAWAICLITHLTMPNNYISLGIYASLSDLYTICLLASLNAREVLRAEDARGESTAPMSSFRIAMPSRSADSTPDRTPARQIESKYDV